MKYKEFISELEQGKIAQAYLFEGKENYLKEEALGKLKEKIILPQYINFNYEIFSGKDSSSTEIMESLWTLPFNGKYRLIVVKEADKLKEKDKEFLRKYLDNPVNTSCLVCIGEKFDKRKKFYRAFLKKGKVISFYPLWNNEVIEWIKRKVEKEGKKISPRAILYLKDKIGSDLYLLSREIEKLVIFIHPETTIKEEDIQEIASEGKGKGVFDLTRAFREKNLMLSLSILSELLERGEDPLGIHSLLTREVRILLRIKAKGGNLSPQEVFPFIFSRGYYSNFYTDIVSEYIRASKNFSIPELIKNYEYLVEAEFSIKRGREEAKSSVEKLILRLLSRKANSSRK